jgi:tRNA-splicing ligase RtcB (3'-phosphate/5'-hydroxy nucleic acid ligase)
MPTPGAIGWLSGLAARSSTTFTITIILRGWRKAFPGQRGFVGGSMGDDAVILKGVESCKAAQSFYSTVRGAGRLFGRKDAKRRLSRSEMNVWLERRRVTLIGGDLDEAP